MTNYSSGHRAERVAADYLRTLGYTIIELNWRHARAEIDIVAQKRPRFSRSGPIVFFEVKHRKSDRHRRGLDYITPAKVRQMGFAAELWLSQQSRSDDYCLGAIELEGLDYTVTACLETIA